MTGGSDGSYDGGERNGGPNRRGRLYRARRPYDERAEPAPAGRGRRRGDRLRQQGDAGDDWAVLFDMDGLLIDSEPLWFETETEVMARLGGAWEETDQQELLGGSLERSVTYLNQRASRPAPADKIGRWLTEGVIRRVRERGVPVMPGARELVAQVAAAGVPYALVTASRRDFADAVLRAVGWRFPVVVTAEDVRRGKPDPQPYRLAAGRLGVHPTRCVALEDSTTGVASAQRAGCRVVAVPTLVAIDPAPHRLVVGSLADVDLATLRQMAYGTDGRR